MMRNRKKGQASSSRNKEIKGRAFKAVAAAAVCLIFAGGVFLVSRLNLFPIKEVVFIGNKYISTEDVMALLGMNEAEGLLAISSKDLSARLLKSPWIKAVSLRKEFPDKFMVKVQEARPYALLSAEEGVFFIDESGGVIDKLGGRSQQFLPVIKVGSNNKAVFSEALALVRTLKEKGLAGDKVEITGTGEGPESLSLRLDETLVKIGQGEYEEKLERFFELEKEIKKRRINVDYVDIRFANRVIVKPVTEVIR